MHEIINGKVVELSPEKLAELEAYQAQATLRENQRQWLYNRLKEYPAIGEQLDIIYHEGIEGWKAKIKAIKDKFPKQ